MDKLSEAKDFLKQFGMPEQQQNDICGYALLTLADIKPNSAWSEATNKWIRIHDILEFISKNYNKIYAENTRESIRKNCMHQFRESALIEDNGKATNSPNYRYRITEEGLQLIRSYNSVDFNKYIELYRNEHETLIEKYASKKRMEMMPVMINEEVFNFSPGEHNNLQREIIEQFAPRFAPNCECLYVGDTTKKDLIKNTEKLEKLGLNITVHEKMPDVILYSEDKDWIYFIEAVTSVGPISPKRIIEINDMTSKVTSGKIFVTAFPNFFTYKKFSTELAWETEIWIAEFPDHMIHMDGDKFLEPR